MRERSERMAALLRVGRECQGPSGKGGKRGNEDEQRTHSLIPPSRPSTSFHAMTPLLIARSSKPLRTAASATRSAALGTCPPFSPALRLAVRASTTGTTTSATTLRPSCATSSAAAAAPTGGGTSKLVADVSGVGADSPPAADAEKSELDTVEDVAECVRSRWDAERARSTEERRERVESGRDCGRIVLRLRDRARVSSCPPSVVARRRKRVASLGVDTS